MFYAHPPSTHWINIWDSRDFIKITIVITIIITIPKTTLTTIFT